MTLSEFSSMTKREVLTKALPLRISQANSVPDPTLWMAGADWSFYFICPWLLKGPNIKIDRYNDKLESINERELNASDLSFLIGRDIYEVSSDENLVDAVFYISGGVELAIHTDTDLDPWVIRIPGITLVGGITA
ncbi:hypothetical protein GCM10022198_11630 [Klugiella xanthotipulae]|uniref:hypothetical protein n=1 Tax=Klugiella xanthotipulae TaxID=244735 RepID=UPI0011526662|nr:hypothetical protein [Klugiella xanthotipulae]